MNDNLTPRERVENALKAAGFVHLSYAPPGEYWRLYAPGYPDRVVIRPNTHNQYSEYVCDIHITDSPEHLPTYLNAKALLEACEAITAAVDDTKYCKHCNANDDLGYGFCGWHADPLTNALELIRTAILAAKGGPAPCNPSASSAPPDPEATP